VTKIHGENDTDPDVKISTDLTKVSFYLWTPGTSFYFSSYFDRDGTCGPLNKIFKIEKNSEKFY
jgi:hypothetical protein